MNLVLFVGELLADLITEENFLDAEHFILKIGGSPGNIAKYLSQLGVPTRMISRVGDDVIGHRIVSNLERYGVDVRYIQFDKEFGTTLVFVQKTQDSPDFFVIRGADRFFECPDDDAFKDVRIMHISCWPLSFESSFNKLFKIIQRAQEHDIKISFDPNCRDKLFGCRKIVLDRVKEILSLSVYSKPSLDDAIAIFGEVDYSIEDSVRFYIEKFHEHGVKNVVLTAGKYGAYASSVENKDSIVHIPSNAKKIIDATGAGDGFWAGMYYGIISGRDFIESCKIGSKVAAHILGFVGADVPLDKSILEEEI